MKSKTAKIIRSLPAAAAGLALAGAPTLASITYIDAVEGVAGNTFATGGSPADTSWESGLDSSASVEDQWTKRTTVEGNGATLFQASHSTTDAGGDAMPELTTRISGLADGTYTIWAFYWDQVDSATQNWTLSAGLTSGSLASYSSPGEPDVPGAITLGVSNAADLSFTTNVDVVAGFNGSIYLRNLFGINLGEATVSGGAGTVDVYVDNLIGNGSSNRSWYDGVGYELVPEPSSVVLVGLGSLVLASVRRRG